MLAIIIPYYKIRFFEENLQSLAAQTDKRFKVYIGDDASPESPTDLLEKYQGKFDVVYYRFETNLGGTSLPQQWERCIALSTTEEWMMILGDDDYIDERVVEEFYAHWPEFQSKSNVVRFASRTLVQEENHQAPICYHPLWESATDAYLRKFKFLTRSSLSEYVFSKKSYEKFGFHNYPLAWNSDDRAWLDFSDGKPIYSINTAVVCSRLSTINITGKKDNTALKNASLVQFYQFLIEQKFPYFTKFDRVKILRQYQYVLGCTKVLEAKDYYFLLTNYLKNANLAVCIGFVKKYV
jgi:glycosyltransferase involved in cell wall biosynthesis